MRKVVTVSILTLALLLVVATLSTGQPRRRPSPRGRPHGRVLVNVGPFWGRPHPWPYFVYAPPPVIVQPPPSGSPSQGFSATPPQAYWYFCPSARAYYPTVQDCPDPWILVPPRP